MKYKVEFSPKAERQFKKLSKQVQLRLKGAIDALALEPRPSGSEKTKKGGFYRIREGDYRIIYEIEDQKLLVLVLFLGHRREIYREL
ncbi:MAG: RelE/StbE family addiction module toxin [bacterium]|nr:MAG: RelE/StbE family addiction module toxin [bacterium]